MDYRDLKLSKNGLPTWDALIPGLIKFMNEKEKVSTKTIRTDFSESLNLPKELRFKIYDKSPDVIIENKIMWAISALFKAGVLEKISRGIYKLSSVGKKLAKLDDSELTLKKIQSLPAYKKHDEELKKRNELTGADISDDSQDTNIITRLTNETNQYNNEIATTLLKMIQESEPIFFENLVVKLLVKMGYKGQNGNAKVTQATNDGGIDGIINQDALGTRTVYLQAKRYKDENVVQRPAIDGFYGALSRVHADCGVFITTSHFSSSAITTAKNFSIVLIDGIQLTNLMLQYHVGVQVKKSLDLFEIDEDFFEE